MTSSVLKWLKRAVLVLVVALVTLLAVRAWDVHRGPDLEAWHTFVPHELKGDDLAEADWAAYLAAEQRIFDEVRKEVTEDLDPSDRTPGNR